MDWSKLEHAYGPASDIPALLAHARVAPPPTDYRSEPWFTLWSSLYHQDDIYSASYAAVPELIAIAEECRGLVAAESLFLAASIEMRRNEPGAPNVPSAIQNAYDLALSAARPLTSALAQSAPDPDGKLAMAEAIFQGDFERARAMLDDAAEDSVD
jgi:hypothetical protein